MARVCSKCKKKIRVLDSYYYDKNKNILCEECNNENLNETMKKFEESKKKELEKCKKKELEKCKKKELEERKKKKELEERKKKEYEYYTVFNNSINESLEALESNILEEILIWLAYKFDGGDNWHIESVKKPLIDALGGNNLQLDYFDSIDEAISKVDKLCSENNCRVYDEKNNHFEDAKIIVLGKRMLISYDNEVSLIHFVSDVPISVELNEKNVLDGLDHVSINDEHFLLEDSSWKFLERYFYTINEITKKKYEVLNSKLRYLVEGVTPEVNQLAYNFIDIIDQNIFLSRDILAGFEHILSFKEYLVTFHCISSKEERNSFIEESKTDDSNLNVLSNVVDDDFAKFKTIIKRKINIEDIYLTSFCWLALRSQAIKFFSEKWENNYPDLFSYELIAGRNLYEIVRSYFSVDYIAHKAILTVGCFTYFLMDNSVFYDNENFMACSLELINVILEIDEEIEINRFEKSLSRQPSKTDATVVTINDIDIMNGYEFENFVCDMFAKLGYKSSVTKSSRDQGLDVIAENSNSRLGIQAKCYSSKVSNKAVQEIVGALAHYKCDKGIVVTNHYFTEAAKQLAESNKIVLWDRDILKTKIVDLYS